MASMPWHNLAGCKDNFKKTQMASYIALTSLGPVTDARIVPGKTERLVVILINVVIIIMHT